MEGEARLDGVGVGGWGVGEVEAVVLGPEPEVSGVADDGGGLAVAWGAAPADILKRIETPAPSTEHGDLIILGRR